MSRYHEKPFRPILPGSRCLIRPGRPPNTRPALIGGQA